MLHHPLAQWTSGDTLSRECHRLRMNDIVYEPVSIKVSGRHQIVLPSVAHLHLGIRSVDRFLVSNTGYSFCS